MFRGYELPIFYMSFARSAAITPQRWAIIFFLGDPTMQRVVVTGMGAVSPLGLTVNETWQNCLNGVSGFAPITLFDSSNMGVHHACEVKGFDPEKFMRRTEVRRRDRYEQLACAAAQAAWKQAGVTYFSRKCRTCSGVGDNRHRWFAFDGRFYS
jgi:3-oxoacyl-(acyl-carrier-protein) synthase